MGQKPDTTNNKLGFSRRQHINLHMEGQDPKTTDARETRNDHYNSGTEPNKQPKAGRDSIKRKIRLQ
jgi:hypothetical protein